MQLTVSYINQILVLLVFAASLNLVMGYAGVFNAAAAAFGAIGGYTLIWLTASHGWSYVPAMVVGVALTGVFGLLVGYAALRLEMLWLLLLTLAVQLVLVGALSGLQEFGASAGLQAENLTIFGHALVEPTQVFPVVAVAAVVVFALCYRIGESPYGRVLRGIRDDEVATRSLGKNTFAYKIIVFTITAAMAGLGGVMLSTQTALASPTVFGFNVSIEMIAMVMIGGIANLYGTIIGVALVVLSTPFFENVINLSTNVSSLLQQLAYGLALVVIIYFRPKGLIPEGVTPRSVFLASGDLLTRAARILRGDRGATPDTAPDTVSNSSGDTRPTAQSAVEVIDRPIQAADAATGAREVVLQARHISKAFGGNRAVDDLNLDLKRGTITALIGPNGAGKTTVFNLLTGALPIDAGRVYLFGDDITGLSPDAVTRRGMARSFQDVRVFPSLTVLENIMLGVQGHAGEQMRNLFLQPVRVAKAERTARDQAHHWLQFIEMDKLANTRVGSLGFGQQKLVALARILATEAEVLLLDEPGSGIDYVWLDEMIKVVRQVRDAGRTVCIVEHNLDVVSRLADEVYFMELGRVTAEGSFEQLTRDPHLTEAYFGTV